MFSSANNSLITNDNNGQADIFVRDLVMGTTELASITSDGTQTNSISMYPSISADGRYVSFASMASNLVAGGTPQSIATFARDRVANTTEMTDKLHDGSVVKSANDFTASEGHQEDCDCTLSKYSCKEVPLLPICEV